MEMLVVFQNCIMIWKIEQTKHTADLSLFVQPVVSMTILGTSDSGETPEQNIRHQLRGQLRQY